MSQKIKVQDGIITYSAADPALPVNMAIRGNMNIGLLDTDDAFIGTPNGTSTNAANLGISAGSYGFVSIFENPQGGALYINSAKWPAGNIRPDPGMFLGVSSPGILDYMPFVLGVETSDTLTPTQLNSLYPSAKPGQYVAGSSVVYFCIAPSQWRAAGAQPPATTAAPISQAMTIKNVSSNYTLQLADAYNTLIRSTSSAPITITIPISTSVNIPVGAGVLIGQNGAGQVTISGSSGVTVNTPDSYKIGKLYGKITAIKVAANTWEIEGNLEPGSTSSYDEVVTYTSNQVVNVGFDVALSAGEPNSAFMWSLFEYPATSTATTSGSDTLDGTGAYTFTNIVGNVAGVYKYSFIFASTGHTRYAFITLV